MDYNQSNNLSNNNQNNSQNNNQNNCQYNNQNNCQNNNQNNNQNNDQSNSQNSNQNNCQNNNKNYNQNDSQCNNQNNQNNDKQENGKKQDDTNKQLDNQEKRDQKISEYGQAVLDKNREHVKIHLLTIIGEIEGHENSPGNVKTTKYEHVLPQLAMIEDDDSIKGVLVLLNTVGGDVSCGLALAEMIASISKPKVSLVIGDSHSIGVPLATAADVSFIVPSGTMLLHPVRMSGMVIGAPQTYEFFQLIQDRITGFISNHSRISQERLEEMMMETEQMTKDLGTLLVGHDAVKEGLMDAVGGISDAMNKLYEMIDNQN